MSKKWSASLFKWFVLAIFAPLAGFNAWKFFSTPINAKLPTRISLYVFVLVSCGLAYELAKIAWINAKMQRAEGEVKFALYDDLMAARKRYHVLWLCSAGTMALFAVVGLLTGDLR